MGSEVVSAPDYVIHVDVYDAQVGVFSTAVAWNEWHKDMGITPGDVQACHGRAGMVTDPAGLPWFVMYIPHGCRTETMAHESLHAAWYLLEWKGIKVDADNHEALAYSQAHLFRRLMEESMPNNSKVSRCVTRVDKTKSKGAAIAICQKATGLSYATGKTPKKAKGKK
jgi:hypothetical protein